MLEKGLDFRGKLVLFGAAVAIVFTALEVLEPLFYIGPVGFTTTEVAAGFFFITVAIWLLGDGIDRVISRRALDLAVLFFVLVNFTSALIAGHDYGSTFKFSLRMTYAAMLYFGISRLPLRRVSHRLVVGTISVTIIIVSMIGMLEGTLTSLPWDQILAPFREETITFVFFYNVRVASTLPFPTVFSFFIELAMPLVITFGIWLATREKYQRYKTLLWLALLVTIALIISVQILTFTRSAYVVTPIALSCGALLSLFFGYGRRVALVFAFGAVVMVMIVGISVLLSDKMASRLGIREQQSRYGAQYTLIDIPSSMEPGKTYSAVIQAKNTGTETWKVSGLGSVQFVYRWLEYPSGELLNRNEAIKVTPLPHDVKQGEELQLSVDYVTPESPGRYILAIELDAISVGMFSANGVPALILPLELTETGSQTFKVPETPAEFNSKEPPPMSTPRRDLWSAAFHAWQDYPIFGMGPDQFRYRWSEYVPGAEPDERLGSHNIFLEALANTGIIGLLALIYLLVRNAWIQLVMSRDRHLGRELRLLALGLLVSSLVYVGHGMFEYPLWQTGISFLIFILLGLTSLLEAESRYK